MARHGTAARNPFRLLAKIRIRKDCDGVQDATENTPTCNQSLNPMSPSSHPSSNVFTAKSIYPGLARSTLSLPFSSRRYHVRSWDCAEVQSVFARGTGRTIKRRRRWQTGRAAWAPHCASSPSRGSRWDQPKTSFDCHNLSPPPPPNGFGTCLEPSPHLAAPRFESRDGGEDRRRPLKKLLGSGSTQAPRTLPTAASKSCVQETALWPLESH